MKSTCRRLAGFLVAAVLAIGCASRCGAEEPYRFEKEIAIGGDGGWDLLTLDDAARRLYVTHATKIVVVDIDKGAVVGEITNTPGVHGIALAPKLGRGFTSNGKENKASVVDLATFQTRSKVDTGDKPDVILYEPGHGEIYAFNAGTNTVTVFDAGTEKLVATIVLPGRPEFAVVDPGAGRVYVNIEDKSVLAAIDTGSHAVVNVWPIAPGEEATGLAIDTAHHRLFLGCHNKVMVMMDSADGKVVASVPIDERVDATAFDPATQFAFSSNGAGNVTIAHEDALDRLTVIQTLATERGARTMALDPKTHRIFLASAKFEPSPEPAPGQPPQRPKIIPGTLKILVYGMRPANSP